MVALESLSAGLEPGYRLVPLIHVAGHVRDIPAEWLVPGAIPVGKMFCDYLTPQVGVLDEHLTELPQAEVAERISAR
jgi:hypothetical protein